MRGIWSAGPKPFTLPLCALVVCTGAAAVSVPKYRLAPYVYVVDQAFERYGDRVEMFAKRARGDQPPSRIISGRKTQLDYAGAVAFDAARNVYVANFAAATVYAAGSSGDATPIQNVTGRATGLDVTGGIAVDGTENIYVANSTLHLSDIVVFGAG
ncbi:MAG: hypothetical protein WBV67_11845, partial [Candidatus Cybelea sp.]